MEEDRSLCTHSSFKQLLLAKRFALSQGPVTQEEQEASENGSIPFIELSVDFYSKVTITDWRAAADIDILDGAAAIIQEYWSHHRARQQENFSALSRAFSATFDAARARRVAALKILQFWRAHSARRSWHRFRASVVLIQRQSRLLIAKLTLKRLKREREHRLASLRNEAEEMRLDPLAWVQRFNQTDFESKLQDLKDRVGQFLRQRALEEKALMELGIGSVDSSQSILRSIDEGQRNIAVLENKRRDVLAKMAARIPKVQTPKKPTTTEEVELLRKEFRVEPLVDLTDMIKRKRLAWNDETGGDLVTCVQLFSENLPPSKDKAGNVTDKPLTTVLKSCLKDSDVTVPDKTTGAVN